MIEVLKARRDRRWHAVRIRAALAWDPWSERTCSNCGKTKPVEKFYVRNGRCPCGLRNASGSWCTDCIRQAKRYTEGMKRRGRPFDPRKPGLTREERNAVRRDRFAINREEMLARQRAKYARRKEAVGGGKRG